MLATLYVYSLFVTKLEDVSDDQPALGVPLQSCVVRQPRHHMIGWLADLSGVPAAGVDAILSVITFDQTNPHITLAQQPLVSSGDGQLSFLPRMLLFLDLPRMYVGALTRTKAGEAIYSQTINMIESAGVESIAQEIPRAVSGTIQVATKRKFRLPNGKEIEPDIVLLAGAERTVLVIDLKYATPPFGPADIDHDVDEMAKWKRRMSDYVTRLQSNPEILAQHVQWTSQGDAPVFGLIVTKWPFPIPVDFAEPIGAVDWPSLRECIHKATPSSICELVEWATNRPDVAMSMALAWTAKEVKVAEWKYRYSVLTPLPKEGLFDLTQKLAYKLWEERGRPLWDDQRDWFDAEKRLAANPDATEEVGATAVAVGHQNQPRCQRARPA